MTLVEIVRTSYLSTQFEPQFTDNYSMLLVNNQVQLNASSQSSAETLGPDEAAFWHFFPSWGALRTG